MWPDSGLKAPKVNRRGVRRSLGRIEKMLELPSENGLPRMRLYKDLAELRAETGYQGAHGFYDPAQNLIVATLNSAAHEIGHYHDFKSGKLKALASIKSPEERRAAQIRNELVAVLYAGVKMGLQGPHLAYEHQFLDWFHFERKTQTFGPHPKIALHNLSFPQIQDIAEWLSLSDQSWRPRLELIFEHYLDSPSALPASLRK